MYVAVWLLVEQCMTAPIRCDTRVQCARDFHALPVLASYTSQGENPFAKPHLTPDFHHSRVSRVRGRWPTRQPTQRTVR